LLRRRRKSRGVALEEGLFGCVWVCGGELDYGGEKKKKKKGKAVCRKNRAEKLILCQL
jgi:hypothetical protein